MPEFVSVQTVKMCVLEVAQYLGVSERTVRWWAATGRIRATRVGVKIWQFERDDVEAFSLRLGFLPARPACALELRP